MTSPNRRAFESSRCCSEALSFCSASACSWKVTSQCYGHQVRVTSLCRKYQGLFDLAHGVCVVAVFVLPVKLAQRFVEFVSALDAHLERGSCERAKHATSADTCWWVWRQCDRYLVDWWHHWLMVSCWRREDWGRCHSNCMTWRMQNTVFKLCSVRIESYLVFSQKTSACESLFCKHT